MFHFHFTIIERAFSSKKNKRETIALFNINSMMRNVPGENVHTYVVPGTTSYVRYAYVCARAYAGTQRSIAKVTAV